MKDNLVQRFTSMILNQMTVDILTMEVLIFGSGEHLQMDQLVPILVPMFGEQILILLMVTIVMQHSLLVKSIYQQSHQQDFHSGYGMIQKIIMMAVM